MIDAQDRLLVMLIHTPKGCFNGFAATKRNRLHMDALLGISRAANGVTVYELHRLL